MACFPSAEWLQALQHKLNSDARYAEVARSWEGDMLFQIEPGEALAEEQRYYLDLWHGKCRQAFAVQDDQQLKPAFTLRAAYPQYKRLLKGEADLVQALLTRKISLQGNMAYILRSVPVVLDFVRCCREVTDAFV